MRLGHYRTLVRYGEITEVLDDGLRVIVDEDTEFRLTVLTAALFSPAPGDFLIEYPGHHLHIVPRHEYLAQPAEPHP